MLANLPEECLQFLPNSDVSPAAYALRFVMDLPGIAVVLNGMSDLQQAKENINTADLKHELNDKDLVSLEKISNMLRKRIAVPCTGCRYC